MEVGRCSRCGAFYTNEGYVCPKCSSKDEFAELLPLLKEVVNVREDIKCLYASKGSYLDKQLEEENTYNIHEEDLINEIKKLGKDAIHISDYDEIVEYMKERVHENDIVLTLGAGNVTKIADLLVKY